MQFVATVASISVLVRLFFGWLFFGWLVLLFGCRSRAITLISMARRLPLFLPSLAGLTLYSLGLNCYTLYSERYFPGFFVLWFLGLLGSIRLPDTSKVRKVSPFRPPSRCSGWGGALRLNWAIHCILLRKALSMKIV